MLMESYAESFTQNIVNYKPLRIDFEESLILYILLCQG
jgi:hypothetical protein